MKCPNCGYEVPYKEGTKDIELCLCCSTALDYDVVDVFEDKAAGIVRETRPGQIAMAKLIDENLREPVHTVMLLEGGTGIGKSYAYLIPPMLKRREEIIQQKLKSTGGLEQHQVVMKASNAKIFVSTTKKVLQNQICDTDLNEQIIPKLGLEPEIRAGILKGAKNYACLNPIIAHNLERDWDKREYEAFVAPYRNTRSSADLEDYNGNQPMWWNDITVEDCPHEDNKKRCLYHEFCKPDLSRFNVLITNHALLGTLMAKELLNGRMRFGSVDMLVVDEAHLFINSLYKACTQSVTIKGVNSLMKKILKEEYVVKSAEHVKISVLSGQLTTAFNNLYRECNEWKVDTKSSGGILKPTNTHYAQEAKIALDLYPKFEAPLCKILEHMFDVLKRTDPKRAEAEEAERMANDLGDNDDDIFAPPKKPVTRKGTLFAQDSSSELRAGYARVKKLVDKLIKIQVPIAKAMMVINAVPSFNLPPLSNSMLATITDDGIDIVPGDISDNASQYLNGISKSLFLSATLSLEGNFSYIRGQLGLSRIPNLKVVEGVFPSPFNLDKQARLYTPLDICPFPVYGSSPAKKEEWHRSLAEEITVMIEAFQGDAFVLFTARTDMDRVYDLCKQDNLHSKVVLIKQGASGGAAFREFEETPHSVLFGLKTFWEGIDVPGDKLRLVVITKLPFPIQSDPIIAIEEMRAKADGKSPFGTVQIPKMLFDLRQAAGRLIRRMTDYGVVAVLDSRIWTGPAKDAKALETLRIRHAANQPIQPIGYGKQAMDAIGFKKRIDTRSMFLKVMKGINDKTPITG
jgi:ATP-dependent DNA helicase DinG